MPNDSREGSPIMALKLIGVGNSTGAIFPQRVLEKLKAAKGDVVYITEAPDGIRITPYRPEFEKEMTAAKEFMKDYRDALRDLAK